MHSRPPTSVGGKLLFHRPRGEKDFRAVFGRPGERRIPGALSACFREFDMTSRLQLLLQAATLLESFAALHPFSVPTHIKSRLRPKLSGWPFDAPS